jgi:hypothetical protein
VKNNFRHKNCLNHSVKTGELQMARWAKVEQRKKARAKKRVELFANARAIFVLLFFATVFVFVQNHRVEIGSMTSASLSRALQKPAAVSDRLRQNALNHEKDVDQINQPANSNTTSQ